MAPSSFASAAANSNSTNNNPSQSRDGSSEWARRVNGATQTFRRPSGATNNSSSTPHPDTTASANNPPARYVPPHRNGTVSDMRYSKDQLLDLYKTQQTAAGALVDGLNDLYVGGWQPDDVNGASTTWGQQGRDVQQGPEICWDRGGNVAPLGLHEMDDEERELFTTSVNTPLKPTNKDNQQSHGRRVSVTNNANTGAFGAASPSINRGAGRRRETSESHPFNNNPLASPGASRDDQRTSSPPPSLVRRRTDMNRSEDRDENSEEKTTTPFAALKRNPTGPVSGGAGFGAPVSPWTASSGSGMPPMGSFGNFGAAEKRPGLGGRAESRFKNLLSKDGSEEPGVKSVERQTSTSNLARFQENGSWRSQDRGSADEMPSGSAALAAESDTSPPEQRHGRGFGTPSRKTTQDEFGFGSLGMTTDNAPPFGHGTPTGHRLGLQMGSHDPMSPTDTNPYQSPGPHSVDHSNEEHDADGSDIQNAHLPGLGGFGHDQGPQLGGLGASGFGNLGRGIPGSAGDRSQTSSVGAGRGFSGFGGLGQLGGAPGGWPATQGGFGTPGRQSAGLANPFGNGIFGNPMGDLQSPGLTGLGGNMMGPPGSGGLGGSRMASMFPPAMQEHMRQGEQRSGEHDGTSQEAGDESLSNDATQAQSSASNQPPPPQQRTMVMPDRMRWIYRDPQGQTQGPWSGLEMHDWYKAGFFSPELLVKKYEDPDYEPLAQLIRRIGNSREPFLVPQIGIPHGAPSTNGPSAWAGPGPMAGAPQPTGATAVSGSAQPPFASSFPSFGTTLTADQQNALERRKQEEQYLMARQKEHLAQAQIAQRMQGHIGGGLLPGQLHHHSSAHSLHSQPSFGSIASPNNYQPNPIQGPSSIGAQQPGFFDNSFRGQPAGGLGAVGAGVDSLGHIREEEIPGMMDRMNLGNRGAAAQFGAPGQPLSQQIGQEGQAQQVQQMLQDRARLQQEQAQHDAAQQHDSEDASNERLEEFQKLQEQDQGAELDARFRSTVSKQQADHQNAAAAPSTQQEPLSLTEQVQKAASAKESPASPPRTGLPQPFPPAPSQSPLPAPAAQRTGRQTVADQLQTGSRDLSQTPSIDTPSAAVAPWAKEPAEAPKGPSLKEIQEMEARKAAEAEELAAAARRAAFQKEMEAQQQAAAVQPGLPASASWATAGSPITASNTSAPAAWAKSTQKPSGPTAAKSMAQIQKEEEARKRKLAAAAAAANAQSAALAAVSSPPGGKSYANLAGKVTTTQVQGPGGAWTTVGAGGKSKTPLSPVRAPTPTRTVTTGAAPTMSPAPVLSGPTPAAAAAKKPLTRSVSSMAAPPAPAPTANSATNHAQEELRKWAVAELKADLHKGVPVDGFVETLFQLPADAEMITETVHGVSSTLDSRHFAAEFIRRKRLADKGQVDPRAAPPKRSGNSPLNTTTATSGTAGAGWSEVAKKGPAKDASVPREDVTAGGSFKVVPAKKKGKR
ncbi:Hypothetical protein R9X50_00008100 [Acrodontium crateriforme]|uniref:GYF domain-containing protein n=1 Tax=Acrodontium crateriforme TaxID=150365 RepID=A0AAQ3LZP9_9PEZI|nr:Hypothetical protein R9X50_00008100 [Acrodontium crateriforme]